MIKLGIVVGHTRNKSGAEGLGIESEYFFNKVMAEDMRAYARQRYSKDLEVKIILRDGVGVSGAYKKADDWGADLTSELHYNSVGNTGVRGTETLSSGSAKSLEFAHAVQRAHCSLLGRTGKSRGVKVRNRSNKDRGWLSLVAGRAPAIIIEPAFGSSPSDANLLKKNQFEIGRAVIDCAHDIF